MHRTETKRAVLLALERGTPLAVAGRSFGIDRSTVRRWRDRAGDDDAGDSSEALGRGRDAVDGRLAAAELLVRLDLFTAQLDRGLALLRRYVLGATAVILIAAALLALGR